MQQALVLVAEDLDHLLPVHHLLNIAVDRSQILLLAGKILGGLCRDLRCSKNHDADDRQRDEGQRNIQHEHTDKRGQNGHAGVDDLGDTSGS